jgi:formiminoglutamase
MYEEFLQPVELGPILAEGDFTDNQIGANITKHLEGDFPELEGYHLALIGVKDDRGSVNNKGCAHAPDVIRKYLYRLDKGYHGIKFADLGDIMPGAELKDTYFALGQVTGQLLAMKIIPIIIGGGHDLTYGQYLGYANNDQIINMAVVDETIDIYKHDEEIDSKSFLYKIFTETPNYLFNFSQLGYQSYFVSPNDIYTLEKLFFEFFRLGKIRENLEEVEPIIRDADMMSFDVSALKQCDAPGNNRATPHGFYGEEACQIARYAGITDKLSSIGFYEVNPLFDSNDQTSQLTAHMIWYFMDGFYARTNEFPIINDKDFIKYMVEIEVLDHEMIFWKSKKSGRWWMQVPSHEDKRYERHQLVPCSYADYQLACDEDIPERWMRAFEKLS